MSLHVSQEPSISLSVCMHILEIETARTLSDSTWAETGTGTVRGTGVEWRSDEGNVVLAVRGCETWRVLDAAEGRNTREDRVGLECDKVRFARLREREAGTSH